jgi:flagellar hook-basal body complex protein FliE
MSGYSYFSVNPKKGTNKMRIGPDPFIHLIERPQRVEFKSTVEPVVNENENKTPFSDILQITMSGATQESRALSRVSREETAKLMIGEEENLVDNMIAGEKSNLQFELNLTIRNKVLDAYNELIRIQV